MIDERKVGDGDDDRHDHGDDGIVKGAHSYLSSQAALDRRGSSIEKFLALSAGALNPGEPVKEPEAHGAGDVENHLADLDL
jgi:hypothetical protein